MALCKKYEELTPFERVEFIGKLVHAVQSDDNLFFAAKCLIDTGQDLGVFEGVTIMPENNGDLTDNIATRWYKAPELLLSSSNYGK